MTRRALHLLPPTPLRPVVDTLDMDAGRTRRRLLLGALGTLAALATACAPMPMSPDGEGAWTGTLAIRIDKSPLLLWTAQYRLQGDARAGRLSLDDLSGQSAAVAQWTQEGASLVARGETQQFDHRDRLGMALFGEDVPMAPLIDWMALRPGSEPAGWMVDVSRRARGVIWARRPASGDQPGILLTITRKV